MQQGNGTPPGFPPFPPNGQTFTPPPFPPNFGPGMTPPGYGGGTPGFRPPPGSIPSRPSHPGLGAQPGYGAPPSGLPRPPSFGGGPPPGFRKEVKTTKIFVGAIAAGISDETMHHLLNVSFISRQQTDPRHAVPFTSSIALSAQVASRKRSVLPRLKTPRW